MRTIYKKHMKTLHELAGEIGTLAESDSSKNRAYIKVYKKISEVLDLAETLELIKYKENARRSA